MGYLAVEINGFKRSPLASVDSFQRLVLTLCTILFTKLTALEDFGVRSVIVEWLV